MTSAAAASAIVTFGMVALALSTCVGFAWMVQRFASEGRTRRLSIVASILVLWLSLTLGFANLGVFRDFESRPPKIAFALFGMVALANIASFSRVGTALAKSVPMWILVLSQAFRLPLEIVMHQASNEGVMPSVMSYAGRNFDIITGALALVLGLVLRKKEISNAWVWAWNLLGFALLLNIVSIALLASPLFSFFGPTQLNTWIAEPPFIWLPTVLVGFALTGHLLVFRALLETHKSR